MVVSEIACRQEELEFWENYVNSTRDRLADSCCSAIHHRLAGRRHSQERFETSRCRCRADHSSRRDGGIELDVQ